MAMLLHFPPSSVVVRMNEAPALKDVESVEPIVVPTKPSATQGIAKRTMASTSTSSKLNGKAKMTATPTKKTFVTPAKPKTIYHSYSSYNSKRTKKYKNFFIRPKSFSKHKDVIYSDYTLKFLLALCFSIQLCKLLC